MNWAVLILSHRWSDVSVVVAGFATVAVSSARPLFKWLEFRDFMRPWNKLADSNSDNMQWLPYFGNAMAAFRSRGKAAKGGCPNCSMQITVPAPEEKAEIQEGQRERILF